MEIVRAVRTVKIRFTVLTGTPEILAAFSSNQCKTIPCTKQYSGQRDNADQTDHRHLPCAYRHDAPEQEMHEISSVFHNPDSTPARPIPADMTMAIAISE